MDKIISLPDQSARKSALDPTRSFIVQAPAGSGKTALLSKRFLRLLSLVESPEEILAITFTRKAASEMRNRIIEAIQMASLGTEPENAHTKETFHLARLALAQNDRKGWQLLENPNRLRIQTIDAFCMYLTRQMPILSHFGKMPAISDDPDKLYEEAVLDIIKRIDEEVPFATHLKQLLLHLNNRFSLFKDLLIGMLAKRDQWLPHVLGKHIRLTLEAGLQLITHRCLSKINETLLDDFEEKIESFADFARQHDSTLSCLAEDLLQPDLPIETTRKQWLRIADWLLTQDNHIRLLIDKRQGFPAPESGKNKEEKALYRQMKAEMKDFLKVLSSNTNFCDALIEFRHTPEMRYTDQAWQVLEALLALLPIVAAQLKIVFQKHSQVDFIEVANAASMALGTSGAPTDLALILDYTIHHLLIDEFQDTSIAQFRLFKQLTSEWQKGDGRTLFIVGDPMQSIYRFREAEVGLFLRTFREGMGNIQLTPIVLSTNFRSERDIVSWVNQTFPPVFPSYEDIGLGAVEYHAADSFRDQSTEAAVSVHTLMKESPDEEGEAIASIISDIKKHHPTDRIAILVRVRAHLEAILPILRKHNLSYQAVEIDRLSERMVIQDLLSLTKALYHPADRIAWLAILRAPWCGLSLKDLTVLTGDASQKTIWQNSEDVSLFSTLSEAGQSRLNNLKAIVAAAWQMRGRKNVRALVTEVWLALEAPAYLQNSSDLNDANAYFDLLDRLEVGGDIKDFIQLEEKTKQLFAAPDLSNDAVQVMTIHKAKGLEFDTVILPGLSRLPSKHEQQLLFWMERPRKHVGSSLILGPIKKTGDKEDTIYRYLRYVEDQKDRFEGMRLLYVAVTRAKKRLHLLETLHRKADGQFVQPPVGSFCHLLWKAIEER